MLFEKAARLKLRFEFRGQCYVEELWDLPVTALDMIFKSLNVKLKEQEGESLLEKKTQADEVLELKVNIVKHIVEVKLREYVDREDLVLKAGQKQKVLGIIAEKQDANLRDLSVEDLKKLANDL